MEPNEGNGGGLVDLGGRSSKSCKKDVVMLVECQKAQLVQALVIWVVMEIWMVELELVVELDH